MPENNTEFKARKQRDIKAMSADQEFRDVSRDWFVRSIQHRYSYNFCWMGLPIIQYPGDIIALQELIWQIRPRAIIETGVARGGSLLFYASMLELLGSDGLVVGVELSLSDENRASIESQPLARRIKLVDGSSVSLAAVAATKLAVANRGPVLVTLDSNHTHDHVLAELRAYSSLVRHGSYIVVFDTVIEELPPIAIGERPWGTGNSPKSAVAAFLAETNRFEIDHSFDDRLLLSVCPGGFLRCIRD